MKPDPELERDYTQNVGHAPEERYPDGEGKWQWDYKGTPDEKAELLERLGVAPDRDENQESLF